MCPRTSLSTQTPFMLICTWPVAEEIALPTMCHLGGVPPPHDRNTNEKMISRADERMISCAHLVPFAAREPFCIPPCDPLKKRRPVWWRGPVCADGHPQVRMCLKHIFVTYEVLFFLRATSAWACFILMASTSYMAAGTKFSLSGSSFKWQHAHLNIIIVRSWFCVQKILLCMWFSHLGT
jgi:hypothetical protein